MLNVFSNTNGKDESARKYRVGIIKQDEDNSIAFRYRKLSRTDITEHSYLKGIATQDEVFIIETKCAFNFDIRTKIIINNRQYSISSIYIEEDENADGIYRKNVKPNKYLILKK